MIEFIDDYLGTNISELVAIPTNELKELPIAEFCVKVNGKMVNIYPSSENGDLYLRARYANIRVGIETNSICIFAEDSDFYIRLSENMIFGIYSYEDYGNKKSYRIALAGNSPDLLLTVVGGRLRRVGIQKATDKEELKKTEGSVHGKG